MASTAQLASHRQTLYFASLHCQQLAGEGAESGALAGEPLQHRQCLLEAATQCLYRSSGFLAWHLVEQSAANISPQLAGGQAFDQWLVQMQAVPAQDPAVQQLVSAFTAPRPLADLIVAYQSMWQPASANPRPADHLQLVDTTISLARCREWHAALEDLAVECLAMQSEF